MSVGQEESVQCLAPAKINLTLHVTGRREDGYHLLESLVVFAGCADRLTFTPAKTLSLDTSGPYGEALERDLAGADNIILKAARAVAEATGHPLQARITLEKALPLGAGLGGGSADAAAVLRGLCRLWGVSLAEEQLLALGARLGADVPVCLRGRPAVMTGIGEVLADPPPLPPVWLVLVNPGVPLATPAVFAARRGAFSAPHPLTHPPATAEALAEALAQRRNDLTAAAISLAPVIGEVLAALAGQAGCLLARMSGSGATCFGLFADRLVAEAAAASLRRAAPGWWCQVAPLLEEPA